MLGSSTIVCRGIERWVTSGAGKEPDLRELPLGQGELLRDGRDVTIVALGKTVYPALEAAESLAESGISCMVVNARFVKPLDRDLIVRTARATGRVLTVEENVLAGGFGSAVLEALSDAGLSDIQVARSGLPDAFVEQATAEVQRANLGLDAAGIAARVRERFFPGMLAVETAQREAGAAAPA